MGRAALIAAVSLILAAGSAWAGPNPNVKLAMHLIASNEYLYCDDFAFTSSDEFDADLTLTELAASGYCGYLVFVAYDLDACTTGVEYFVRGWPMGRGAPAFSGPTYCQSALVMGQPFEALGGEGGIAVWGQSPFGGDTGIAPFAYISFDLSAHTAYLPVVLDYAPSSLTYVDDPHNYVLGPQPDFAEDPVVSEAGCIIGAGTGGESIHLLSPNGGEAWAVGSTPPIEWEASGVEHVTLEWSADGGATWQTIETGVPDTRFYLWTVPDEPSAQCLVRVSDADGTPADASDGAFEVFLPEAWRVLRVPSQWPTIQRGIWAAVAGDTVKVAPGTYYETLLMKDRVAVVAEGGSGVTTLDATGYLHGVVFGRDMYPATLLEGFTITGGHANGISAQDMTGGGILFDATGGFVRGCVVTQNQAEMLGGGIGIRAGQGVRIEDCVVSGNEAESAGGIYSSRSGSTVLLRARVFENVATLGDGGGLFLELDPASVAECLFYGNSAHRGGAIYMCWSSPTVDHCTLAGNRATERGGGMFIEYQSYPTIENTIIASSSLGGSFGCNFCSTPTLACCDVYGNFGGDWVDCIKVYANVNGNMWKDPLLCCPESGNYHLQPESPCADAQNCGRIGAFGIGCSGPSRVERETWGGVKRQFK